jgi:hypothetical protein
VGTVAPDAAGRCPTTTSTGQVVEGKLKIPNLGPNRYALSITPPDGSSWIQTTTLEGNLDWDAWVMEGATGLDTEFVVAGEPFPAIIFGYVPGGLNRMAAGSGSGTVKGVIDAVKAYIPARGGVVTEFGMVGGKIEGPVPNPWVALSDLTAGDTAVYVAQGNADGTFEIPNVPPGNYTLTWWDTKLNHILNLVNVTVGQGETVDMGVLPLLGWWTRIEGYVFNDLNNNGKRDAGEPGIANYTVAMKKRENSLMDRGAVRVTTDANGYYVMENAYPMTQWLVVEAYDDRYLGTGITFQADNQPQETTVLGAGVDVSVLPIIGLSGRLDWGKRPFPAGTNGGIVGTVSYDTTRNELDPRYAAVEDWQPGISNLWVNLYQPVACTASSPACSQGAVRYELAADGSYARGKLLNSYLTETWQRPGTNGDGFCVPRDWSGLPYAYPNDQQITNSPTDCIEAPLMGIQFQNGFSTVDGNYGFGDGCFGAGGFDPGTGACADGSDPTPLTPGDYLVKIEVPNDARGRPVYQVTKEEDINIFSGDEWVPQIPPPECAGALHTVHVVDDPAQAQFDPANPSTTSGVYNPDFFAAGGTPYEGMQRPLCDVKLVRVSNGRSVAPTFNFFTDVPIPGRFWGLVVDDLNFSTNPRQMNYGEKAGVPFAPVGIYDYTNRLITTVESDYSGIFDVLLPSTNRINCPTPSGVCANVYRFVGNDPGIPGRLNSNYRPEYRTIAAEFEAFPGLIVPADLAPTQVGVSVQLPGGQVNQVSCALNDFTNAVQRTPEFFAVDRPYVRLTGNAAARTVVVQGQAFGTATGSVLLSHEVSNATVAVTGVIWGDQQITFTVPGTATPGPYQMTIQAANGRRSVNGVTIHAIGAAGSAYAPNVLEVGQGRTYATIQAAIDARERQNAQYKAVIVVYPGTPDPTNPRVNPRGAYYENLVVTRPVKLQGVGPGGIRANGVVVAGSIIDGGAFGGDTALADAWRARIAGLTWVGNQNVNEGQVVYVLARTTGEFLSGGRQGSGNPDFAAIDGFDIRGGDQMGFPNNINETGGTPTGLPPNVVTQGGAIFLNGYVQKFRITNNVVQNNGGSYGTVRIGTPDLPAPDTNNHNEDLKILGNRVIANAGTNLAGGIGIFAGADRYEVARNDICGNFSAEYGGGVSVYGLSPGGDIHHNRIYFNRSYDEGGGIMIAGQLPANPATVSPGSGPVSIHHNVIQANLANDDGGGIRFLMAGPAAACSSANSMNVYDNFVVNNVSTHEGGGISLNDSPCVRIVNNTIMKNLTTATAVTSNGQPAPAGLSSSQNSDLLQARLPIGSPSFSNPLLFNNVFWDNRAGTRGGAGVTGLGINGAADVYNWDLAVADGVGLLSPTNSILQVGLGTNASPTNTFLDPRVVQAYDVSVSFQAWRTNPTFIGAILVAVDLPPNLLGDYHLGTGSPAYNLGAASKTGVAAPTTDIDDQARPQLGGFDAGADERTSP